MKLWLQFNGVLLIALALLHAVFPSRFRWSEELRHTSLLTRQIFYVHTFFIALVVGLMGLLCLATADDLLATALGRHVCAGLLLFWLCRLFVQFFGYSAELWRGKRLETAIHVIFSLLWLNFSACFAFVTFAPGR